MPKMKPHSGMKKRVKVTGGGKLRHLKGRRVTHLMEKKGTARTRLDDGTVDISKRDAKRVRRLLAR